MALATLAALLAITQTAASARGAAGAGERRWGLRADRRGGVRLLRRPGELSRFLDLYYLIPPAVARGYSDTRLLRRLRRALGSRLSPAALPAHRPLHPVAAEAPPAAPGASLVARAGAAGLGRDRGRDLPPRLDPARRPSAPDQHDARAAGRDRARGRLPAAAARGSLSGTPLGPGGRGRPDPGRADAPEPGPEVDDRIASPLARVSYESPALEWQRADSSSVAARRLTPDVLHRPEQWCCDDFGYPTTMREFALILNGCTRSSATGASTWPTSSTDSTRAPRTSSPT